MGFMHHLFKKVEDVFGSTPLADSQIVSTIYQKVKGGFRDKLPETVEQIEYEEYTLFVRPRDYVSGELFLYGEYEPFLTKTIESLVSEGDVVIDIGAHVGHHSLTMRRKTGENGEVHLFEPHPQLHQLLGKTVAANDFENVHVHSVALTEQADQFQLSEGDHHQNNLGGSSLTSDTNSEIMHDVEGVRFDDFIGDDLNVDSINLVKMDVEGYEGNVLKGMGDMLGSVDYILMELHHYALSATEQTELLETLLEQGSIVDIENDRTINSSADFVDQKRTHILWFREGVDSPKSFST